MRENGRGYVDKRQTALLESAICAVVQSSIKVPLAYANDSNILFCAVLPLIIISKKYQKG